MILHYLKIAWRNLLKYRTQTVVSILGLAVGFACFALSTIWIRYELTFDAFQPGAGRTYVVFRKMSSSSSVMGMSGALSYNNLQALRNKVPEVEAAGCLFQHNMEVTLRYADANLGPMQMLLVDSGFVRMFGIELLRGDYTFISQPGTVAIEQQTGMHFTLVHYSEHALDSDTDSRACSYVGLKWASGEETWGCGTHTDIIVAGIRALVSAINNK